MSSETIYITGAGIVSPIGIGNAAFWQSLLHCQSGIRSLGDRTDEGAKPNPDSYPAGLWIGAPLVDFDAKQYVRPRKSLKVMCREIQTAYAATQMALEQAQLTGLLPAADGGPIPADRVGTVFGSEMFYGPPDEMLDAIRGSLTPDGDGDLVRFGSLAMREILPLWMLKYLPNMPACHVGISLNARGPNNSLVLGEVSGPAALIESAACIRRGIADLIFCGAAGTRINTTRMNYRGDLRIPDACDPVEDSSRPHHPDSTGVVAGEGAATLVVESQASAEKRGQRPLAVLAGAASRFYPSPNVRDGSPGAGGTPGARGSSEAIRIAIAGALAQAKLRGDQIALVVSQAIGDTDMDAAERLAVKQSVPGVPLVAPVASIGHTGAAIGTIGLVTGLLALQHRIAPPTRNAASAVPEAQLLQEPRPLSSQHVLCLSHTSEGNAVAVVLSSLGDDDGAAVHPR